jgi:hypothetical protein
MARAEDRPTNLGAVKAGEMAGFGAEIAFTDRPCTAGAEQVTADGLSTATTTSLVIAATIGAIH